MRFGHPFSAYTGVIALDEAGRAYTNFGQRAIEHPFRRRRLYWKGA
jgi:hypothetical protein